MESPVSRSGEASWQINTQPREAVDPTNPQAIRISCFVPAGRRSPRRIRDADSGIAPRQTALAGNDPPRHPPKSESEVISLASGRVSSLPKGTLAVASRQRAWGYHFASKQDRGGTHPPLLISEAAGCHSQVILVASIFTCKRRQVGTAEAEIPLHREDAVLETSTPVKGQQFHDRIEPLRRAASVVADARKGVRR